MSNIKNEIDTYIDKVKNEINIYVNKLMEEAEPTNIIASKYRLLKREYKINEILNENI